MNILITGAWSTAAAHVEAIEALGHAVVYMPRENEALPCSEAWVEAVVCNGLFLYHDITRFENLRFIQLTSAGCDRVPMSYINARGITIYNARGVYSVPMAEYALLAVLQFYKQSRYFLNNQQQHIWEKHRGLLELTEKTVCIVGCGSVGTECAKRFAAMGCRVIGVDRFSGSCNPFERVIAIDELSEIVSAADVLVLALPLDDTTYHIIDAPILERMKTGCVIVNIARGAVIDTTALMPYLQNKRLFLAADVFESEPLAADDPLWNSDHAILTPHNSFVSDRTSERLDALIMKAIADM